MKPNRDEPALPDGNWTHSFEEDEANVQVYRPTDSFAFPPGRRRRETLEFGADGQVSVGLPGPDDRVQTTSSSFTALGMNRFRLHGSMESPDRVLELVAVEPDILKVRLA